MTLIDLLGSFQGHECENRLYLLDGARLVYNGYYERLLGSLYRTFRIRKKCTSDDLAGVISRSRKVKMAHIVYTIAPKREDDYRLLVKVRLES